MNFWKNLFAILGINFISGGRILDGRKGGIGCGWVVIFIIIFFPIWLIFKLFQMIFRRRK